MMRVRGILVLSLVWISIPTLTAQTIRDIESAWKKREADLRTGRIEWTERILWVRGSLPLRGRNDARAGDARRPLFPESDKTTESRKTLVWQGTSMHFSAKEQLPSLDLGRFVDYSRDEVTGATDGARRLLRSDAIEFPTGRISKSKALSSHHLVELIPVMQWIRPIDPSGAAIDLRSCSLSAARRRIGESSCIVLVSGEGRLRKEWTLDPAKDFSVMRFERMEAGAPNLRADTDYDRSEGRWRPVGWRIMMMASTGKLRDQTDATVAGFAINEVLPENSFTLAFPNGTWVDDDRNGSSYIITAADSKRAITRGELIGGATYRDLLRSPSGLANTRSRLDWRGPTIVAAAVILFISAAWVGVKRIHRS